MEKLGRSTKPTIDLSDEVKALTLKLNVPYRDVARIDIRPSAVEVTLYLETEDGHKYLDSRGDVAMTVRTFGVKT